MAKICVKCNVEKVENAFPIEKRKNAAGIIKEYQTNTCYECKAKKEKERREKNKIKKKEEKKTKNENSLIESKVCNTCEIEKCASEFIIPTRIINAVKI